MNTDLIIIGAGPGGYRAAAYAASQGLQVVLFEQDKVGGTCLNVGCIPTKTYIHAATFAEARERMAAVVSQLRQGVETILSHPNITLIRGKAEFADAHTVRVSPCSSTADSFTAPNIIIATGSETKWLRLEDTAPYPTPILDGEEKADRRAPLGNVAARPCVVDSTGLLQLDTLPKRLCIIGAGVIGMEFASVFHRFGSEVTVIEYLKECLPALDSDIAKRLRKYMEKQGITFHMQCAVKEIADGGVIFENKKGQMERVAADVILMATGRKPRTDGLNLAALGITLTPQGAIPVDDNYEIVNCKSSNCKYFAIGDVNGRQMLAHAAEMQAKVVVDQIVNLKSQNSNLKSQNSNLKSLCVMPAAIFTEPEAACVGPTEDQLKEQGIAYVCKKAFWRSNGKALAMNETEGMLKLFVATSPSAINTQPSDLTPQTSDLTPQTSDLTPQTSDLTPHASDLLSGRILGCHAYGAHAADIVQEVSVLMCKDTTIEELAEMVHIHPTLSEILYTAALT